ncbi:MAG TPA: TonB-dependent receptor [Cytophagaceae bacterium]|nr:TonB-dependent receptor [Cytophagaceae bacterium]
MKRILHVVTITLFIGFLSLKVSAQTQDFVLKGRLVDELTNEPMVGAIVQIKGTSEGVMVDDSGYYELKTKRQPPFTISVSAIGYDTKDIEVYDNDEPEFNISMRQESSGTEVVVIGYGEQKRKDVTGSVSSVPTELKSQPVASVERLLQGTVAGAVVTQTSGQPGGGVSVQIRGNNSITAGSDPLYVIDGFPINNDYSLNDAGVTDGSKINPLSSISTTDIESIDVLKDASATAIYGSRGANGVVIITTKKGSKNQSSINYDMYTGFSEVIREIPVMDAAQWWQLRKEAAANSGKSGTLATANATALTTAANAGYTLDTSGQGTNWQDAAFRRGHIQSHNLSVLSGTDKTRIAISGNYFKQDGVLLNTDFIRYAGRVNLEHDYSEKLKITSYITASNTQAQVAPAAVVGALLLTPPSLPIYNNSGGYVLSSPFESALQNPINSLNNQLNQTKTNRFLGNVAADYKLFKGLTARILFGADVVDNKQNRYLPISTYEGYALGGFASVGNTNTVNWLNENTLNYSRVFNKIHSLNVLGGFTAQKSVTEGAVTASAGYPNDLLTYNNIGVGVTTRPVGSFSSQWTLASWLGRVNYGFNEKYLLTLTLRADGSSRFGPSNKWGYFPSIAVAWNAHEENFLKGVKALSNLKIRTSLGNTGNQAIPPYSSLAQLSSFRYNFSNTTVNSFAPLTTNNPNLGWEKTTQFDIGTDIGLFKNRISIIADYYYKKTSDLLLNAPVSGTSGLSYYDVNGNPSQSSTAYQNIGVVQNQGVELAILTENVKTKRFTWNTNFIFSKNSNKILSLGDGINQIIPQISQPSVLQVGAPVGSFLVYETDGVIQQGDNPLTPQANKNPGGQKYKDINGDGKITQDADRVVIKNKPPYVFGLTNTVKYAGFDLTVFIQASIGGKLYNSNRASLELGTGYTNASTTLLDHWTPTNTSTDVKAPYQDPAITISDRFIEDASYGRLKNLTLGYTLPIRLTEKAKFKSIRIYVSAQNMFTITKYTGFDPEVSFTGQSLVNKGIDQGVYPNSKTYLGGISVTL